jgi:hypothetical protein
MPVPFSLLATMMSAPSGPPPIIDSFEVWPNGWSDRQLEDDSFEPSSATQASSKSYDGTYSVRIVSGARNLGAAGEHEIYKSFDISDYDTLSFFWNDQFGLYVRVDGSIQSYTAGVKIGDWEKITVDISAFSGVKEIGISCRGPNYVMLVDYFKLSKGA